MFQAFDASEVVFYLGQSSMSFFLYGFEESRTKSAYFLWVNVYIFYSYLYIRITIVTIHYLDHPRAEETGSVGVHTDCLLFTTAERYKTTTTCKTSPAVRS
jgi:hypothetical protein